MHEFSLCRAVAAIAEEHAQGRPVTVVRINVGHFRQVVPATMVRCWELLVPDTALEGSQLMIREVPAVIDCSVCGARTPLTVPVHLCGSCGGTATRLVSGDEFIVDSIDIAPVPEEV